MSNILIGEIVASAMFIVTLFAVMIGFPVAFTLAGMGLIFGAIGNYFGVFDFNLLNGLASRYFGVMINEVLVAVPLFVFMGVLLERSKIAVGLLTTMGQLFGTMRGGLGISVVLVGALLAASTGIVGATVVTMGLLSLPAMMRAGYDPKLASGIICASGTLGQIVPPSTVLIFLGDLLAGANQQAQLSMGNFTPQPLSVGQLFAGALIPGVLLMALYIGWVLIKAAVDPKSCPPVTMTAEERAGLGRRVAFALVPPLLLIFAVLGSILSGLATATESASVGAMGAILLALLSGNFSYRVLKETMLSTLTISSMVFVILLGASVFSLVFRGLGGEHLVEDTLAAVPGGQLGSLIVVMAIMFVLGFFLDTFEIIFIVVPIAAPALIKLGIDPLWLGVAMGINLQTSFLTPPFGFSLFYLRGVAADVLSTTDIYRGVLPFVALQMMCIALLWVYQPIATWLPEQIFGSTTRPALTAPAMAPGDGSGGFGDLFDEPGFQQPEGDFGDLFGGPGPASPEPLQSPNDLFGPAPGADPASPPTEDEGFGDLFGPGGGS